MPSTVSDCRDREVVVGRHFGSGATTSWDKHLAGLLIVTVRSVEDLTLH